MEYNVLKQSIAAVVKANGNEEITGDLLQQVLIAMVDVLGAGYQFAGLAVPTTNPGTPDAKMFYIATQAGTYSNFGSPAPVLTGEQVAILRFSTSWTAVVLDIPTKAYVDNALSGKVDKVEGKGLSANDLTNELVTLINGAFQKANITDELGTDATKVLSQAAITTVLLQYAKVDGYYSSLTAGAAENLVGRGSVPASFLRRTTGGTADVGTGSAKIAKLMGNSIVWNQLVNKTDITTATTREVTFTNNGDGSITVDGTADGGPASKTTDYSFIAGHKYLIPNRYSAKNVNFFANEKNVWTSPVQNIFTATTQNCLIIQVAEGVTADNVKVWPQIFDLTKMFGAGKEPSTVAEFEALFPLDYYAYNAGAVLPFAAQKLVTTGFNQWDEEWEQGSINNDGTPTTAVSYQDRIRSKNFIPAFPNTEYYGKIPAGNMTIHFYDSNKNHISETSSIANATFTTPANCAYIKFRTTATYGNVYNNDICINLSWSGYRNGEYEPYELHELVVDPANWEDANGDKIFPYGGMHGVGTARDFATPDNDGFIRKATRCMKQVDLGDLSWTKSADGMFWAIISDLKAPTTNTERLTGLICDKYIVDSAASVSYDGATDKTMKRYDKGSGVAIYIKDSAYAESTAEQFGTAMSGVNLVYELAEPVEIELAEPVAASYYANDFGTEEWQPANDDEPYTAPCEMQIAYAMNAVDTLRRLPENYISVGSFENFCTELATKLGAALNKNITITPTYDSENAEYDYSITIADIEG